MSMQLNVLGKFTEKGLERKKKKESTPSSRI